MVGLVVERAVEAFLTEIGEGVDSIADISGGDGGLCNLQQTDV